MLFFRIFFYDSMNTVERQERTGEGKNLFALYGWNGKPLPPRKYAQQVLGWKLLRNSEQAKLNRACKQIVEFFRRPDWYYYLDVVQYVRITKYGFAVYGIAALFWAHERSYGLFPNVLILRESNSLDEIQNAAYNIVENLNYVIQALNESGANGLDEYNKIDNVRSILKFFSSNL